MASSSSAAAAAAEEAYPNHRHHQRIRRWRHYEKNSFPRCLYIDKKLNFGNSIMTKAVLQLRG